MFIEDSHEMGIVFDVLCFLSSHSRVKVVTLQYNLGQLSKQSLQV